jgi:N-acylneuraminate cytidylyltransferase/CMP-N,N'-diacetyllegionaminic acid synthase
MSSQVLGVIPARGGSKGIPKKNLAALAGRPMIAWTIEAALRSRCLTRVIVSTDDQEIADISQRLGAEVPFLRPAELARDETPGIDPVLHLITWLETEADYHPEYVMLLQPTSPLRTTEDIDGAFRLATEHHCDSVISVSEADTHPYWMKRINDRGELEDFSPVPGKYSQRQDLPPAYKLNGAIYLVRTSRMLSDKTFYGHKTLPYIMPAERSLDVDSLWDLHVANLVANDRHGSN